uniref:Uncharacterized protein n=1 Tax=Rhizophora mucronata TaxID=61149 RepID=A0A2P2NJR5_RHIMU
MIEFQETTSGSPIPSNTRRAKSINPQDEYMLIKLLLT